MSKSRTIYFDILNIVSCFAVLCLHHNGIVHWYKVDTLAWKQSLAFEVVFYWAVPVFFMLSGATLINYRHKYSTREFFKRRVLRVIIPFIFWSLILLLHAKLTNDFHYKSTQDIINAIFFTKIRFGDIYWFFIPLIALYCIIPVISLLKNYQYILWYIVGFIFITHSSLPLLFSLLGIKYNHSLSFPILGYAIFIILGYLLSKNNLSKKQRMILYGTATICIILRYVVTYYLSDVNGKLDRFLFGYIQFHSVILASAVFVFFKNLEKMIQNKKLTKFIYDLSSHSLGIYLIHKLIMHYELQLLGIKSDDVLWRFIGMFMTYLVCLFIVFLIRRIPFGKYIT